MDSTYCWQCQQIGVPPHTLLLRHFSDFERKAGGRDGREVRDQPILVLGGRTADVDPPIRDADLVAASLVIRSLSRTSTLPSVRLDLSGELITCEGARTIAAVLQVSDRTLRSLLLRRTHVGDNGAAALGAVLSSMLLELDLGECAITDAGLRYLVRGSQLHGAPSCLSVLLLDGNATGDAGTIEVISFVEGNGSLSCLSVQPALPRFLSQEVEAALQVACELSGVILERKGRSWSLETLASKCQPHPVDEAAVVTAVTALPRSLASPSAAPPERLDRGRKQMPVPDVRHSGHLASWMAGTERELRELKWLLSSSSARLDGQHRKLMSELEKLRFQLDAWTSGGSEPDEGRLDVLEARFDALEQLVGREQSECAQMWQLVEVAAGSARARSASPR
eukprot:s571_g37.t1